jgi:hypothetical protein
VSSPFRCGHSAGNESGLSLPPHRREGHPSGVFSGLEPCRGLRAHRVGVGEFLEEWYDRSAESCDIFDNISEVDKYSVTCTVCRHFEKECGSLELKGPGILDMLKATYHHDGHTWHQ